MFEEGLRQATSPFAASLGVLASFRRTVTPLLLGLQGIVESRSLTTGNCVQDEGQIDVEHLSTFTQH